MGDLERMEENRMHKKIFTQELEGTRRRGRPRKGWREVERDLQVLGVRRWRELVIDREKWKNVCNLAKLEEMSKGENIVKWIKGQRISWLGHPERMEEDRMPEKIFTQEQEGTRRRGRPRKGWREEVERDLQVLGVRRWRELVIEWDKWKGIGSTGQSSQRAVAPTEQEEATRNTSLMAVRLDEDSS